MPTLLNGFLAVMFLFGLVVVELVEEAAPLAHFEVPLALGDLLELIGGERVLLRGPRHLAVLFRHRADVPLVLARVLPEVDLLLPLVQTVVILLALLLFRLEALPFRVERAI